MSSNESTHDDLEAALLDDERLMRLHDGDLDPEHEAEVRSLLAAAPEAARKLRAMQAIGALLRERADADARADGIADAVMLAIDVPTAERPTDLPTDTVGRPSDARELPRVASGTVRGRAPANDNSRSIFAIAGIAAAAAAALFAWGRTQPVDPGVAVAPLAEAPMTAELSARLDVDPKPAAPVAATEEEDAAVEIAAVDLGSQEASVFYVPGNGASTAVVWINDAGEDQ